MTWAIVLGGSSGLGFASARRLGADGFKLCVVYRESRSSEPELKAAMAELERVAPRLLHFNADALTEHGRNLVLGALDQEMVAGERVGVLLHSIAKGALKPLATEQTTQPTLQSRDLLLTIEAMGTSLLDWVNELRTRQLLGPDVRVLAFTSEGSRRAWRSYGAVSAAKATLESLVRTIAFELGPFGVRANCIQAGVTETRALSMIPNSEHLKRLCETRNPLGRLTRPEDVANAVSLLCRPEAAWINGTTLVVDGGEHLC